METAREVEAAKMQAVNGAAKPNAESAADVKQNAAPVNTDMMQNTEAAPVNANQTSDTAVSAKTETQRILALPLSGQSGDNRLGAAFVP